MGRVARRKVLRAHMAIVQGALQSLGLVLGGVGALTLASAMSLSVVERTRELGVMQTLGATPARVIWVVVAEALFTGALSWLAAVALAVPLSTLVGAFVGSAIFGAPLPLVVSPVAVLAWLAVALMGKRRGQRVLGQRRVAAHHPGNPCLRLTCLKENDRGPKTSHQR